MVFDSETMSAPAGAIHSPDTSAALDGSPALVRRWKLWLVLLLAAFVLLSAVFSRYTVDDAFISLRYARNLAGGHGLVYSTDGSDRVEGYTNFLWVVIEAALFRGGLAALIVPAVKAIGCLFGILFLLVTFALARRIFASTDAALAAVFVLVLSGYFAFWTVGGLETPLYLFLVAAALYCSLRIEEPRFAVLAAILFVLLALTRPEGAVLFAIVAAAEFVAATWRAEAKPRRGWLLAAAIFTVLYGAYFLLRWRYYGYFLPNTFYARAAGETGIRGLIERAVARGLGSGGFYLLVAPFAGVLAAAYPWRRFHLRALRLLLVFTAALLLLSLLAKREWMPGYRYELPAGAMLALFLSWPLTRFLAAQSRAVVAATLVGLSFFLLYPSLITFHSSMGQLAGYQQGTVAFAKWLRDATPPGIAVAGWDQGTVPYYSEKSRIIEIHPEGLLSNYLSHHPFSADYVFNQKPEILLLPSGAFDQTPQRPPDSPQPASLYFDPRLAADYEYLATICGNSSYCTRVYGRHSLSIDAARLAELRQLALRSRMLAR